METIKLRVWDKEENKMYYFDLTSYMSVNEGGQEELCPSKLVGPDAFMQFTGLLDKNGKEIYKGDIIYASLNDNKYILKYGEYSCEYDEAYPKGKHYGWYLQDKSNYCEGLSDDSLLIEVIGNIYENPEMLDD